MDDEELELHLARLVIDTMRSTFEECGKDAELTYVVLTTSSVCAGIVIGLSAKEMQKRVKDSFRSAEWIVGGVAKYPTHGVH